MASLGFGYGQFNAGPFGAQILSRQWLGALTVQVGLSTQLSIVDEYSDGSEVSLGGIRWSSSAPNVAFPSQGGLIYGISLGECVITVSDSSDDSIIGTTPFTVTVNETPTANQTTIVVPLFYSHLTQILQNYFDWKDSRIRKGKYSIDAQFLNISAQQLQLSGLRLAREIGATNLHNCPANIDNGGVYYQQSLPNGFDFTLGSHSIVATRGTDVFAMTPYQDELPIPARVSLNPDSSVTALQNSNLTLFTATGIGTNTPQTTDWSCQRFGPFTPIFPNRIHLWLDGPGYEALSVEVKIIGQRAPIPAWADSQVTTSETVTLNNLGWITSKFAWASILNIQVLGLPVGVTLTGYMTAFALPQCPDPTRPYSDPTFRDVIFNRYWSIDTTGYLTETYLRSDYEGWEYAQSYATDVELSAVAVEPNTWGGFAASGAILYYFDRREPLPAQSAMQSAALLQEPYYGLEVDIDPTQLSPVYYVTLSPVAYANASQSTAYRYLVTTPDSAQHVLTPAGLMAEYTQGAGWRSGVPESIEIPLGLNGTYIFTLQTVGPSGILYDSTPWQKLAFTPLATFDLSSFLPEIQGLAFDDRNRLWAWSGSFAIPLQMHYDGYIIDQPTNSIYLTDSVDGLVIDGIAL